MSAEELAQLEYSFKHGLILEEEYSPRKTTLETHTQVPAPVPTGLPVPAANRARVYTWGLDPTQKVKDQKCCLPKLVPALNNKNIIQVAAGTHCNAALAGDGAVYTWGKDRKGRLGHGNEEDKLIPTKVKGLVGHKIAQIACGVWHMGGVTDKGELFLWGNYSKSASSHSPRKIELNGKHAVKIGCGQMWSAVILGNGNLVIMDKYGKLNEYNSAKFDGVWCGSDFGAAVDDAGRLWIFGYKIEPKIFGPAARPATKDFLPPFLIDLSSISEVGRIVKCSVTTGEFHQSIGILNDAGCVYMWGSNYKGKLGVGDFEDRPLPTLVQEQAADVQIGGIHAALIDAERNLFTFGCGSDGRLGHPESKDHRYLFHETRPRLVNALEQRVLQISCSYYHCIALVD